MSAAAQVALGKTVTLFEERITRCGTIGELTHDLRQPLSAIEAISYYLELTLPPDLIEARGLLGRIQTLLEQADCMLDRAEQKALALH